MSLNYGVIGNRETAALVSEEGSIDWCCFPRFDSPSVFAKILDQEKGGSFEIVPMGNEKIKQEYVENTNILSTIFQTRDGKFEVLDFFPVYIGPQRSFQSYREIQRLIKVREGNPKLRVKFRPRFDYARDKPEIQIEDGKIVAEGKSDKLLLSANLDLEKILSFEPIKLEDKSFLSLSYGKVNHDTLQDSEEMLDRTKTLWRTIVDNTTFPSDYKKPAIRSLLVLELMRYEKTGATIAAITTSLPEIVGEQRNWDYRYCWLRDSALTVEALTELCHFEEVREFMKWLIDCCEELQTMRSVEGGKVPSEKTLNHLAGYKGSKPVRIGNGANEQIQNDVYGEVLDSIHKFFVQYEYVEEMTQDQWNIMSKWVDAAANLWKEKDHGIWEFRGEKDHFTFSKLLCWVALDRGAKIASYADKHALKEKWREVAERIREDILENGWNEEVEAFTQRYGSESLDASLLLIPHFGFLPPDHPQVLSTIDRIDERLRVGPYVYRYKTEDDFGKPENAFILCSLWLAEAQFLAGRKEKAKKIFEELLDKSNHLGLFSEDINTKTEELTGNFPQAYTHLAIIDAAVVLCGEKVQKPECELKLI